MKKFRLILCCILIINSINCFSQSDEKDKKEFKSKIKYVYGYSNDFKDALTIGISFEKSISSTDTNYYIKFNLYASSEPKIDICFDKKSSITFLAKSSRVVDLKMTDLNSLIKSQKQADGPHSTEFVNYYSAILSLEVTKEELVLISLDPFYKIFLPYFHCSSKVYNKIELDRPTLFVRREFIQKNINYILEI